MNRLLRLNTVTQWVEFRVRDSKKIFRKRIDPLLQIATLQLRAIQVRNKFNKIDVYFTSIWQSYIQFLQDFSIFSHFLFNSRWALGSVQDIQTNQDAKNKGRYHLNSIFQSPSKVLKFKYKSYINNRYSFDIIVIIILFKHFPNSPVNIVSKNEHSTFQSLGLND